MDSASLTNTAAESEPVIDDAYRTRRDYSGRGNLRRMRNAGAQSTHGRPCVMYGSYLDASGESRDYLVTYALSRR